MDKITVEQRSRNMARIKGKNTSIEVMVCKELFKRGYRYRKNDKILPGKPDVVLPKYDTVIFVHGCFWHRHSNCKYSTIPKSNTEYWMNKLQGNVEKDNMHRMALQLLGWNVIEVWECEIKHDVCAVVDSIECELKRFSIEKE